MSGQFSDVLEMPEFVALDGTRAAVAGRLINFPTGKSGLQEGHRRWLQDKVVPTILGMPNAWIDLYGYASKRGNAQFNLTLSQARAETVKSFLAQQLATRGRSIGGMVKIDKGFGEDAPGYSAKESDDAAYWRAAEVVVFGSKPTLVRPPPVPPPTVDKNNVVRRARLNSQVACFNATRALDGLLGDLDRADKLSGVQKVQFMANLLRVHGRTVFVVKEFLKVNDPLSNEAREVYRKAIKLFNDNRNLHIQLVAEASNGPRCRKSNPPAFAWTARYDPEPRISCCDPTFFNASEECRRDVVTHEVFHALGLIHVWERHPIRTSDDALQDCNSLAQAAAFITDRSRNRESCAHHLQHNLPV